MDKTEVLEAIETLRKYKSETSTIEVKTANGGFPKKCFDTFSSFANKNGGIIIFGLSEENEFKTEGVYDINDLQKQISSLCSDALEPSLRVLILPLEFEEKNILAVKVEELNQNKKPCYYKPKGLKAGAYTRIGDRDELLTDYEIYAMQSYNDHIFEDIRPTKQSCLEDLNEEELQKYIVKLKLDKPNFAKDTYEQNLKLCGILDTRNGFVYPTLAGTLIFGKYPQSFYPGLFVACVVVPGFSLGDTGENGERFIDNKRVEGTIEEMLDETIHFLRRNMKVSVTINEDGKRIDKTEYPIDALREAVANALIHRDYSGKTEGTYISVYMYKDRIEITNPGGLYGANKLEKLDSANLMETRNPNIVRILEEKGNVIENRHTGISTMKREMKKYNLPEPEFYEENSFFRVTFRNNIQFNLDGGHQSDTQSDTESDTQSDTQSDLNNEIKQKVLEYCKEAKTAKEIREHLGISSKRYVAYNILRPMIEKDILEYTNKNNKNAKNQKYIAKK